MKLDIIYNEDCLEGMEKIPDGSIDCVICDLPYGVLNKQSEGGKWDSILPLDLLWKSYSRIVKPNGAIVLFAQGLFTAKLILSQPKLWRYNLVWNKCRATGFLNANRMPLRYHEDICVFYKKMPTYNPQMEELNGREKNHPQGSGVHKDRNSCYGKVNRINPTYENKKFPGSIITIKAVHCNEGQFHPTQKPVELIRYLIRTYSNEGDIILDNCSGSGTTAVASVLEDRHFICFEKDKAYYDLSIQRLNREISQLKLF